MQNKIIEETLRPVCIILAEDDAELRFILARMLSKEGYKVEEIGDGETLARRLFELLAQPADEREVDVVISDIYMPGGTAIEVVESLKERLADLPIIFITSDCNPDIVARALELGVREVLSKPVDFVRLKKILGEQVRRVTLTRVAI
jgi:two-component system nitrogen regulation response regulator GlnG